MDTKLYPITRVLILIYVSLVLTIPLLLVSLGLAEINGTTTFNVFNIRITLSAIGILIGIGVGLLTIGEKSYKVYKSLKHDN